LIGASIGRTWQRSCSPLEAEMTKRIALFLTLATMMVLFSVGALAQVTCTVKGNVKGEDGKPLANIPVEFNNLDNGHKYSFKTDKNGNYFSMSPTVGKYKINVLGPDGKVIFFMNNVSVISTTDNTFDVDISKELKNSGISEEQRKATEKVKKDNEKIKGLNALLLQATAQKSAGKWDDAVATMEQAAAMDQTHDIVYGSLGDAYIGAKKFPEAETAYEKAIELAPAGSKALANYHSGLALAMLRQSKTESGMAECDKSAQLDPTTAGLCYFNEGAILTNQGKPDEANQAFDKAIAADPNRVEAYYQKGVNLLSKATLSKDGKMVPAPGTVEALNKYLQLAPDGKNAQAAKDLLASLGETVQTSFGTSKKKK
jgi:Flp pilus assembly protein TadD